MNTVIKEYFSHKSIIVYLLLLVVLLTLSYLIEPIRFFSSLWIFFIPIVLAPFAEWILHKYSLHRIVDPKLAPKAYNYMLKLHYRHHWDPNNLIYVFAPISAAFILFGIFTPLAFLLFKSSGAALIFIASIVLYFLYYEWIHLSHHIPSYRALTPFGKLMRKAHSWHHYKNESFWWGVTNPIGDYAFGTFKDPKEVEFSPSAKALGNLQNK